MSKKVPTKILESEYEILDCLGEGTFAVVQAAVHNKTKQRVAVKQVQVQQNFIDEAEEEVEKLIIFKNDHIIKIVESFYDPKELVLDVVMQLCNGSLREQLQQRHFFNEEEMLSFIVQMVSAFLDLDRKKLMHLDYKPENVLRADKNGRYYKICDFGCAQISAISRMSGYEKSVFGTFNYLAPELLLNYKGKKTRNSADIWAFGITLYEMMFWRLPFTKKSNDKIIDRTLLESYFQNKGYQIPFKMSEEAPVKIVGLIKKLLVADPVGRMTWVQLKEELKKQFKVQEHEFLNVADQVSNAIPVIEVFLKAIKLISDNLKVPRHQFWKQGSNSLNELRQILLYYLFIVCDTLSSLVQIKKDLLSKKELNRLDQLFDCVLRERQTCRDKLIEQERKDLSYREMQLIDELKGCLGDIKAYPKQMDVPIKFMFTFCTELLSLLKKEKGLFEDKNFFVQSLKFQL